MTPEDLPVSEFDYLALSNEFNQLQADVVRANELERKDHAGEALSPEERSFLDALPQKMLRAVEITRILRRTNTGPAKVKTKSPRGAKKALAQETIDRLIDL